MSADWNNEQNILTLRRLWADGISTTEIARRMNISKNAVVGKAYRLQLPARESPIIRGAQPPGTPKPAVVRLPRIKPAADLPSAPPIMRATPLGGFKPCCWPLGEPGKPGFHFCGANALGGKPYCSEHDAMAYVRHPVRREYAA